MSLITYKATGLKAVKDHVLVKGMEFNERITTGGIIVPSDDGNSAGIRPRWAEVIAVGPKQKDIKVGEFVLVAHGRWTRGLKMVVDGKDIDLRRVDANDIMLISEEPMDDETWSSAVMPDNNINRIEGSMHNSDTGCGIRD